MSESSIRSVLYDLQTKGVPQEALAPIEEWLASTYPRPHQLTLGEILAQLGKASPDTVVPVGFTDPHSYRGFYNEVAFCVTQNITVKSMQEAVADAIGTTYQGWKGGDYAMDEGTRAWLVADHGDCGESIGAILLTLMLSNAV